jgi:hypothetical protein
MVANEKVAFRFQRDKFDAEAKASRQQVRLLTTALLKRSELRPVSGAVDAKKAEPDGKAKSESSTTEQKEREGGTRKRSLSVTPGSPISRT